MEGLQLFSRKTPVEMELVSKLKSVQEELNDYKEELALAETRVSAHAHILRLLAGEPIPGMCGGCYLKLKKRVRALEGEHLSSEALAKGSAPKEDEVEMQKEAKPVRAARRLPRPGEAEPIADGLGALMRINVIRHQREPSSADSVAAVIDDSHLAAGAGLAVEGGSALGDQEESQGEIESGIGSPEKMAPQEHSENKLGPEKAAKPSGSAQEDSGDWSVNGALKEGESEPSKTGHSPLDKTDYKSVEANDDSSEEGSTARAGGEGVEMRPVEKPLSRVLNLSNKSIDSSASSIVGPAAEPEGGSSEGQAESEWKDALDDDADDLSDDGDSKAPALGIFPVQGDVEKTRVNMSKAEDAEAEKHENTKSEGSAEHAPKAPISAAKASSEKKFSDGIEDDADASVEFRKEAEAIQLTDSSRHVDEGDSDTLESNGVAETEGPAVDKEIVTSVDHVESPASSDVEETVLHVVESTEGGAQNSNAHQSDEEPVGRETEGAGNIDARAVNEEAQLHDSSEVAPEAASAVLRENVSPSRAPVVRRQRPKFALNYGFAMAMKDAEKTREEGLSKEIQKQQRLERLLRQKEEKEREEREKERAEKERLRQAASRRSSGSEGILAARPPLEKNKENRNPVKPAVREKRSAPEVDEVAREEQSAPPSRMEAPVQSFSQALASKPPPQERESAQTGGPRKVTGRERMVSERVFIHNERDKSGRLVNILQGLELHKNFLSEREQQKLIECIYDIQKKGQAGDLLSRTYTQPRKWMRGKGRVTIQFGCCYNYAIDKMGNPPGIMRDEEVDPLPHDIVGIIDRLVDWGVMPPECRPDSCIINIYDEGDCIPPHIDHHDFLRPFCTLSLLSEAEIVFGTRLQAIDEGVFDGPVRISLPVGSVLILNGNGADLAKHCIPGVPAKRISITLRKMDPAKAPYHLTQTALHTPLPGPPPQNDRGGSSDRWRKEEQPRVRFPPARGEETWPELGLVEDTKEKTRVPPEGGNSGAAVLQGVWGKRQQEAKAGETDERRGEATMSPIRTGFERPTSNRIPQAEENIDMREKAAREKLPPSTLRAQAAPFEAPPKRLASPSLEALARSGGPADRGASFDSPPPARGAARVTSSSLTSSPAKKWASSTEAPVAATSDLAMAVRKMVEGEGGRAEAQNQNQNQNQNQGAALSAAAPEFAPPRREAGARPRSGGVERKAAAPADKFVDSDSTSWADIEVDTVSPRQTVWPPSRDQQKEALTFKENERNDLERRLRALDNEPDNRRGVPRGGNPRFRERPSDFPAERSADRLNRLGFGGMLRDQGERWGHEDRAREPSWPEDRRGFSRAQDDMYSGSSRVRGIGRPEEGAGFRESGRQGERLVTHSRAEALKEAGGW